MKIYQVDAFSSQVFAGNAAAVIILDDWLNDEVMQKIAMENNLSETSFSKKIDDNNYEIRWFSPVKEVQFCCYGTLATSFIIFKENPQLTRIIFKVKGLGNFYIRKGHDDRIIMDLPIQPPTLVETIPEDLKNSLNQDFSAVSVYANDQAYIVVYPDPESVLAEQPNFQLIKNLGGKRVAITALNNFKNDDFNHIDIISRYFTPSMGIDEDPVTGSLHTSLIPLWQPMIDKKVIAAYQASKRGGILYCELLENNRIEITGHCKLYLEGKIYI